MCKSKAPALNVLLGRGGGLLMGDLCLSRKRIMSSTLCQGHYVYKELRVLWTIFKILCGRIIYESALTLGRRQNLSSKWLSIHQGKLTCTFFSLFFPCPSKYHTHSNRQLQGSRWGVQINPGESGESPGGGLGGEWRGGWHRRVGKARNQPT